MERKINVNGVKLERGLPKICVPVSGSSIEEIIWEIEKLDDSCDLIEWRADSCHDDIITTLKAVKNAAGERPILVTYRTESEGGKGKYSEKDYFSLLSEIIKSGRADLIDIEFYREKRNELITLAKNNNVVSLLSYHNFEKTLSKEEIIQMLGDMEEAGGDVPKMALMPQDFTDVLSIMSASLEVSKENFPIITIAMGKLGKLSRVCGEFTGSAISFGSGKLASAPGQIKVPILKDMLKELNK